MSESNNTSNRSVNNKNPEQGSIAPTIRPESWYSGEHWINLSFSDVSKHFKKSSSYVKGSSEETEYNYNSSSVDSTLEDSSSMYPPSNSYEIQDYQQFPNLDENYDVEKFGSNNENDKTSKGSKLKQVLKTMKEFQWTKIIALIIIIGGIITAVVSATIDAAIKASNSGFGKVNHSKFGRHGRHLMGIRSNMVDPDTPNIFYNWTSSLGDAWKLVFSDEFNCEGRTFYPGDDQFWEAVDMHYAATDNMEWLDPSHVTTKEGALRILMEERKSHGLNYTSGMVQSWNKLCFTQGYVETSIKMPGTKKAKGLWPAFWALGNLARAGYMASTEGTWPYSYDSCDIGVTANQSSSDGLSRLPGQKLNSCICKGEDHPNPGTARSAPEIDIMEGLHDNYAQTLNVAPFDIWRYPDYEHIAITNHSTIAMNSFMGTSYQEAISAVITSNPDWYDRGNFIKFGMEYRNDMKNRMDNYINFYVNDQLTFRVTEGALHPDGNIDWRTITKEPMSLVLNLGLSRAWSKVQLQTIQFPVSLEVDYVRIYQPVDRVSLTCDPPDYPTYDYIQQHINAYTNANLTTWRAAGYEFPPFSLTEKC